MVQSRFLTHTLVLLTAALLPLLTSLSRPQFDSAYGAALNNPLLRVATPIPFPDGLVSRRGFIPNLNTLTPDAPPSRGIITYSFKLGDTLSSIGSQFGLTADTVRWANNLEDPEALQPGQTLVIPPANGVLVRVQPSTQVAQLAAQYRVPVQDIIDANLLRDPDHLVAGSFLLIPGAQGPALVRRPPPAAAVASLGVYNPPRDAVTYVGPVYGPPNPYPWGWCTWWVAHKRAVPWTGNAWEWWGQARRLGVPTGMVPKPGAIMVQNISYWSAWGHVAYVESVEKDGTFTVSEMNYGRWGVVDLRKITSFQGLDLLGFIY